MVDGCDERDFGWCAGVDRSFNDFGRVFAAAEVLTESGEFAGHRPTAIVGEDSRESGSYLVAAICKGLNESGVDVRKVGVLPTPAVSYLITELKADLGVMVSASHNPARDNGIKFFSRNGRKLDDALEAIS